MTIEENTNNKKLGRLEEQIVEEERSLNFFDKYLSVWVAVCIILGTAVGYLFPKAAAGIGGIEVANVSLPATLATVVGVLVEVPIIFSLVNTMKSSKAKFAFDRQSPRWRYCDASKGRCSAISE